MSQYDGPPRERRGFRGTSENAKTVMCTRFTSPEGCRFGDRCNFAHTDVELKPRRNRFGGGQEGGGGGGGRGGPGGDGGGRGGGRPQGGGREGGTWAGAGGGGGPNAWGGGPGGPNGNFSPAGYGGGYQGDENGRGRGGGGYGASGEYQLWGGRGDGGFGGMGVDMPMGAGGPGAPAAWNGSRDAYGRGGGDMYGAGRGGGAGYNAWGAGGGPGGPGDKRPDGGDSAPAPAHGWTTHSAPDGHCYYYNSLTKTSQWERPADLGGSM